MSRVCSQSSHERLKASSEFPRLQLVGYVDEHGMTAYEAAKVRGAMRNCHCGSTLLAWTFCEDCQYLQMMGEGKCAEHDGRAEDEDEDGEE